MAVMHLDSLSCVEKLTLKTTNIKRTMSGMSSPKQATLELVQQLDDDVTFEDIIYELYVLEKIQRGMKDAEEGKVVSHEEARQRLDRWLR